MGAEEEGRGHPNLHKHKVSRNQAPFGELTGYGLGLGGLCDSDHCCSLIMSNGNEYGASQKKSLFDVSARTETAVADRRQNSITIRLLNSVATA